MIINQYLQTISLFIKIIDTRHYLIETTTLEKSENIDIFDIMISWLNKLEKDTADIIKIYYSRKEIINQLDSERISNDLKDSQISFKCILENFKFIPIQTPNDILKRLVEQTIKIHVPQEFKIENFILKNIYAFNFSESEMKKPPFNSDETNKHLVPVVLSMTAVYIDNPLLWPLILHEYGHAIYNSEKNRKNATSLKDQIKVLKEEEGIGIEDNQIFSNIAEVFSDLFGINYYGYAYFFAFFFHEVLSKDVNALLNLKHKSKEEPDKLIFEHTSHPPSLIRLQYMLKELNKNDNGSHIFDGFNEFINPIIDEYNNKILTEIPDNNTIYFKIYDLVSEYYREDSINIFGNNKCDVDTKVVDQLYSYLNDKLPIGTYIHDEAGYLKDFINNKNKNFDLALPSKISDIIISGWKYFLQNIIIPLYTNPNNYLPNTPIDKKDKKIMEANLEKFKIEYLYLLNNIIYSIETSVITSYYSGDNNDR